MSAMQPEAGFSNSPGDDNAPKDSLPEVATPDSLDPGYSNERSVGGKAEAKVLSEDSTEDKAVKKAAAKKTSRKQS